MGEWKEWDSFGVEFPRLEHLRLYECPKLEKDLPKHLPKLTTLAIRKCGQLVCCLPLAPSICALTLEGCDDVVVRSAGSLNSLTDLNLENVSKIPVEFRQLHCLVALYVYDCPEMKEMPTILHSLTSLKILHIRQCESLLSCSEMGSPPMLEMLMIQGCPILQSLPEGMIQTNTTLQSFTIWQCKKLELSLPEDITHSHYASLTDLTIGDSCDSLTSFPLAFFPKLNKLRFRNCGNLESLYISDGLHHVDLTSLQSLNISDCPNLVSFPRGGLPAPNLTLLGIYNCKKLKLLPKRMHTLLTSLQRLTISGCPEIDSFPEGGLPINLFQLHIGNCNKLMACRMEWGLQTLPFLREFSIGGHKEEILESFPEERFLPSTLTSLSIVDFPNLKSLDYRGLQHLTSLETLAFSRCENLKSFPKQGLPSSLSRLDINYCPLLRKRCQRDKGKEWPKISHIPCILFDKFAENEKVILS